LGRGHRRRRWGVTSSTPSLSRAVATSIQQVDGAAAALAQQSSDLALIAHLKLQIEKLNRDRFGPRSERTSRLLDQMELQLEELEASATKDELAAEAAAAQITDGATHVAGFTRKHPVRRRGGGR